MNLEIERLKKAEKNSPNPKRFILNLKKAIVKVGLEYDWSLRETLDFLNYVLTALEKKTVTINCVRHHVKNVQK